MGPMPPSENAKPSINCVMIVPGAHMTFPGILAANATPQGKKCFVKHTYILDQKVGLPGLAGKVDVHDASFFDIQFPEQSLPPNKVAVAQLQELLLESLHGINDVLYWSKTRDQARSISTYARRLGLLDIRAFFVLAKAEQSVFTYKNPLQVNPGPIHLVNMFLGNMITSPNPYAEPISTLSRRLLGIIDLFNMCFYTEAFVVAFSLLDDLTQRVLKAGMVSKGIKDPDTLMSAIKESRLFHMLESLMPLVGYQPLSSASPELVDPMKKINKLRNRIMHGDLELTRQQGLEGLNTVFGLLGFLGKNPFGVPIKAVGWPYKSADIKFEAFRWVDSVGAEGAQEKPSSPSRAATDPEVQAAGDDKVAQKDNHQSDPSATVRPVDPES